MEVGVCPGVCDRSISDQKVVLVVEVMHRDPELVSEFHWQLSDAIKKGGGEEKEVCTPGATNTIFLPFHK